MSQKETVVDQAYDLLLYLVPQLAKYPRSQKFLLADRIQTQVTDLLEVLVEAYYSPRDAKRPLLLRANLMLEKIRYQVRLSKDLRCISVERYGVISGKVDEIGRAVGGWLKAGNKAQAT